MDEKKHKIGIIGLGPVGSVLAVHLAEAGCEVAICDFVSEKMNLIRKSGISLVGKMQKSSYFKYVFTSLDALLNHKFDILISAVKAYHVDSFIREIEESNSNDLILISAQNGIDVREKYTSGFEESKILRMVINYAGNLHAPNVVNITFFNPPNYIASVDDSNKELSENIASVLSSVDLETKGIDSFDLEAKIWEKTILNAALSPLCAISKLTMKEAMSNHDTLEIVEQIIYEAVEVAKAEGIIFGSNFVKLCIRYLKNAGDHFPSLAVDLINKRQTEIDYMNGKFVEYGRKHYVRTPLNLTLTNLVRAITHKNVFQKSHIEKL